MTVRAIGVAVLLSTLPVAGCGTVANLAHSRPEQGGRTPFGGVERDLACIQQAHAGDAPAKPHRKYGSEQYPHEAMAVLCALDLPFSLVGDVVTWPYTFTYSRINAPTDYPPVALGPPPTVVPPLPPLLPAPNAAPPMPIPTPPGGPAAEGRPQAPAPQALPTPKKLP